ncbi:stress protein [Bacillus toyonensis]|uniref:stress protein n=1 Tax=Bacillus toyonensis TaxID=155322 RepID=UPI003D205337
MKRKLLTALACSATDKTATESKQPEPGTTISLISRFKKAGIEAENATDLPQKEFGNMRKDGKRIFTPKLGEDKGDRVFEFSKKEDLEKTKKYYDELGNSSPMLFSHTYAKGNFLLQINGDMKDQEFNKYKEVMDKVVK